MKTIFLLLIVCAIVGVLSPLIANESPVPPGFFDHSPCPLTQLNTTGYNATQL